MAFALKEEEKKSNDEEGATNDNQDKPKKYKEVVKLYDKFKSKGIRGTVTKAKTHILLNENNECMTFGNNAKFVLCNHRNMFYFAFIQYEIL